VQFTVLLINILVPQRLIKEKLGMEFFLKISIIPRSVFFKLNLIIRITCSLLKEQSPGSFPPKILIQFGRSNGI